MAVGGRWLPVLPAYGQEGQEGEPGLGGPSVPLAIDVRGRGIRGMWKRGSSMNMAEGDTLISVDYEVFGKMQGVFFHKYTQAVSKRLGLVGWVPNTDQGTAQGQLQGPISKVRHMQEWLETKGRPKSHMDRANFNNEKVILKLDYSDFQIVK